ncbi:MAG: hypothetical protein ACK41F_01800 [Fimbriimonadaceae bacterium]
MPHPTENLPSPEQILADLKEFIEQAVEENHGSTKPVKPKHRVPFSWPPKAISHQYHIPAKAWTDRAEYEAHGERFPVRVAHTPHGVFGRCEKCWHEAKGDTLEEMLRRLQRAGEPLFRRQLAIGKTLGFPGRFVGRISDLAPQDLVRLLYCPDRDVAYEAKLEIEKHASLGVFGPALIHILRDDRHPHRRSAQWCVLDMMEDIALILPDEADQREAISAMRDLLWNATDDYARTVYKAGVVIGGHLPGQIGKEVLLECFHAPSKYGRRAAMHGVFHVVEWHPPALREIVGRLREASLNDPEPILRRYAAAMADDLEAGRDHGPDPVFPEEEV